MKKVLVMVDPLNDFYDVNGSLFGGPSFRRAIPFMVARAREYAQNGCHIFILGDSHEEEDLEFTRFPKHAVAMTWGSQIIGELVGLPHVYVPKTRFDGFYKTRLDEELLNKNIKPDTHLIEFVGCCAHICIMDTIASFTNRDYTTTLYTKGTSDFNNEMYEAALRRMVCVYGTDLL